MMQAMKKMRKKMNHQPRLVQFDLDLGNFLGAMLCILFDHEDPYALVLVHHGG
jgi:hypothetical protein